MPSYTIYLYADCDYESCVPGIRVEIFQSKKDMYTSHIKNRYFHDLNLNFSRYPSECWYCNHEKYFLEGLDNDGYPYVEQRDNQCTVCNREIITLDKYFETRMEYLIEHFIKNGIIDKYVCTEERVIFLDDAEY